VTASVPFVFAKYTGANAPFSGLERDACRCLARVVSRISRSVVDNRFGDEFWGPDRPRCATSRRLHDYPYQGEAVVGGNLHRF
jgi:hypothetical protein